MRLADLGLLLGAPVLGHALGKSQRSYFSLDCRGINRGRVNSRPFLNFFLPFFQLLLKGVIGTAIKKRTFFATYLREDSPDYNGISGTGTLSNYLLFLFTFHGYGKLYFPRVPETKAGNHNERRESWFTGKIDRRNPRKYDCLEIKKPYFTIFLVKPPYYEEKDYVLRFAIFREKKIQVKEPWKYFL